MQLKSCDLVHVCTHIAYTQVLAHMRLSVYFYNHSQKGVCTACAYHSTSPLKVTLTLFKTHSAISEWRLQSPQLNIIAFI